MGLLSDAYRALFKRVRGKGLGLGLFNRLHALLWEGGLQPESVEVHGGRLFLPRHDAGLPDTLRMGGEWEPELTAAFRERVHAGMTFVDIGANVGYYTLLASKLVGAKGKVLAFEPDPQNFALLVRNIMENGLANAQAYRFAVGKERAFAELHLAPDSPGSHSIAQTPQPGAGGHSVEVVALDELFGADFAPDAVKLDIEGAEPAALQGMRRALSAGRPMTLFVESNDDILRRSGSSAEALRSLLAGHGFRVEDLDDKNLLCTRP